MDLCLRSGKENLLAVNDASCPPRDLTANQGSAILKLAKDRERASEIRFGGLFSLLVQ